MQNTFHDQISLFHLVERCVSFSYYKQIFASVFLSGVYDIQPYN